MFTRLKEGAAVIVFVLFLGALCGVSWFNPFYNWDILPYAALVGGRSSDPLSLHAEAYRSVESAAPPEIVRSFNATGPNPRYRQDMASNPWHFAEQLPLYSVKPLYLLVLAAIHHAGPSALEAAELVSVSSFAILGIVLFVWMRRSTGGLLAAIGVGFLLSTAEFIGTGAETTPDAFFAALGLVGLFFLFAEERAFLGLCTLGVLPLVRSDGLVLLALALAFLIWKGQGFPKRYALVILIVEVLVIQATGWLAGGYGFQTLFYHSFVERLTAPAEVSVRVTWREYFHALHIFALGTLTTARPLYFLLGLTSLKARRGEGRFRQLAWLGLVYTTVHILAFPLPDSRFLVLPFALFILWAVHALAQSSEALPQP